jgi:hypothetical protein
MDSVKAQISREVEALAQDMYAVSTHMAALGIPPDPDDGRRGPSDK